jgi:hypothetical protein
MDGLGTRLVLINGLQGRVQKNGKQDGTTSVCAVLAVHPHSSWVPGTAIFLFRFHTTHTRTVTCAGDFHSCDRNDEQITVGF